MSGAGLNLRPGREPVLRRTRYEIVPIAPVSVKRVMIPVDQLEEARRIIAEVCARRDVCIKDVTGGSRFAEHMAARIEAQQRIKAAVPALSTVQIGAIFNCNHTSVLHNLRRRM